MTKHGLLRKGSEAKSTQFSVPNLDQISVKRVDPAKLEVSFAAFFGLLNFQLVDVAFSILSKSNNTCLSIMVASFVICTLVSLF